MVIAYDVNTVQDYVAQAALMGPARPVLIDQFLEEATEVDVDALADGTDVVIGGIMEHIEEAGSCSTTQTRSSRKSALR